MEIQDYVKKRQNLEELVSKPENNSIKELIGLLNPYIWEPVAFFGFNMGASIYSKTETGPDLDKAANYLLVGAAFEVVIGSINDIKEKNKTSNPFLKYTTIPASIAGIASGALVGGYLFPKTAFSDGESHAVFANYMFMMTFAATSLSLTALRTIDSQNELRKEHQRNYTRNLPTRIYDSLFDTPTLALPTAALAWIGTSNWASTLTELPSDSQKILAATHTLVAALGAYALSNSIGYKIFHSSNIKHNFYSALSSFWESLGKYDKAADYREKILTLPITNEDEFSQRIQLVKLGRDELYHTRMALELGISNPSENFNYKDKSTDSNLQSLAKALIRKNIPKQEYHILKAIEKDPVNPDFHFIYADWLKNNGQDPTEENFMGSDMAFGIRGIQDKFIRINEGRHEVGLVEISKDSIVIYKKGPKEQMIQEANYTDLVHEVFPKHTIGISSEFSIGDDYYLTFRFAGTRLFDLTLKNQAKVNDFWQVLRFLAAYYPTMQKEGIKPDHPIKNPSYTNRNGKLISNSNYFQNRFNDLAKGYMQDVFGLEFPKTLDTLSESIGQILQIDDLVLACDPNWKNSYITREDKLIQADFEFPKLFPLRLELERVIRFGPSLSEKDIHSLMYNFYMNYQKNLDNKPKKKDFDLWFDSQPTFAIASAFDMMGYRARDFRANNNLSDIRLIDYYFDTILGQLDTIEIPDKRVHINSVLDLKTKFNASQYFSQSAQAKV